MSRDTKDERLNGCIVCVGCVLDVMLCPRSGELIQTDLWVSKDYSLEYRLVVSLSDSSEDS